MGKDRHPWHQVPHSPWGFGTLNCGNNLGPPATAQENANSVAFPAYLDLFGAAAFSVNGAAPLPLYHNPMIAAFGLQEITSSQRKFTAFDQSTNQTSLIFTSAAAPLITSQGATNPLYMDLLGSNETNVTDGNSVEEMHEDTEEIDALLYSDSEDYVDEEEAKGGEEEEEEASTGHSPVIISKERSIEEVASSKTLPTKKRRLDSELDASLVDTASSARVYCSKNDGDLESSCVGAGKKREETGDEKEKQEEEEEISNEPSYYPHKRIKRERIQETVGLLRRIIPGGKGKDAVTILDEAISYLKSLKLKTMAFGAASAATSAL